MTRGEVVLEVVKHHLESFVVPRIVPLKLLSHEATRQLQSPHRAAAEPTRQGQLQSQKGQLQSTGQLAAEHGQESSPLSLHSLRWPYHHWSKFHSKALFLNDGQLSGSISDNCRILVRDELAGTGDMLLLPQGNNK